MNRSELFLSTQIIFVLMMVPSLTVWGGPRIAIDSERWDFGDVYENLQTTHAFVLGNVGDSDVRIDSISPDCTACTTAVLRSELNEILSMPVVLRPRRQIQLYVSYVARFQPGGHATHFSIRSDDPVEPDKDVYLSVNILPLVSAPRIQCQPERVDVGILSIREQRHFNVRVRNSRTAQQPLRIRSIWSSEGVKALDPVPDQVEPDTEQVIAFTIEAREKGALQEKIEIATNDPVSPNTGLSVVGYVTDHAIKGQLGGLVVRPIDGDAIIPGKECKLIKRLELSNGLPQTVTVKVRCPESDSEPGKPILARIRPFETKVIDLALRPELMIKTESIVVGIELSALVPTKDGQGE